MKRRRGFSRAVILMTICFFSSVHLTQAQSTIYNEHGWQLEDFRRDSVYGTGVNRAYDELLKGKKPQPVIVAIIDMGVDTSHEDLVGHIWTNKKEIPGNGIDDDHNGYTDDMHGWNFLGSKTGDNIITESFESYREYYRLKNTLPVRGHEKKADSLYRDKVKKYFLRDSLQAAQSVSLLDSMLPQMRSADSILKFNIQKDSVFMRDVVAYQPTDSSYSLVKNNAMMYFRKYGITPDMSLGSFIVEAEEYLQMSRNELRVFSGDPNEVRRKTIGDRYDNPDDKNYGNNNVSAGNPEHGTHVSGIIAASRGNGKGMDGIDDSVYIMTLRVVPEGDERDKDIALAIRYAVDNGALIINMSFGKYLSPGKAWVDDAVRYAADHNVLIVHAAGNEARNVDSIADYPNPNYLHGGGDYCCFINVGATSGGPDSLVVARYSNYGKKEVDLFAPGVKIYSTVPGNQYASYSGTSMASPVVAGIAALLLEYYPDLSAAQLKSILMQSVMKLPGVEVKWMPAGKTVDFAELSVSGGIVNAYNALLLAATIKGERKQFSLGSGR